MLIMLQLRLQNITILNNTIYKKQQTVNTIILTIVTSTEKLINEYSLHCIIQSAKLIWHLLDQLIINL